LNLLKIGYRYYKERIIVIADSPGTEETIAVTIIVFFTFKKK